MANNRSVTFEINIKNSISGELSKVSVEARSVEEALKKVSGAADRAARQSMKSFVNLTFALDGVSNAVNTISSTVANLASAYAVQEEAERKLSTVMQQRMSASAEEIQSIKDLAAAQQSVGIIGDEVQLAGAQQIATFLHQTESIKVLIPAMNDLVAQQKGLNASSGDAVSVANLMGKAMTGQTSALRRVGITFTEAQEQVLKYGDEMQRANMLAQVITDNVGHMNKALAQTPSGEMQQFANKIGDVKEQLGAMVSKVQPYLTLASTVTTATTGFVKLANAIKTAATAFKSFGLILKTGVFFAIVAVIKTIYDGIKNLSSKTQELTDASIALNRAQEAVKANYEQTRASIELNITRLKEFNGTRTEEKKLIDEMNGTYGTQMGYFKSVAEWYNALTQNAEAYCSQLIVQTQLQQLASQAAEIASQRRSILYNEDGSKRKYSTKRSRRNVLSGNDFTGYTVIGTEEIVGTSAAEMAQAKYDALTQKYNALKQQMSQLAKDAESINFAVKGSQTPFHNNDATASPSIKKNGNIKNDLDVVRDSDISDYSRLLQNLELSNTIQRTMRLRQAFKDVNVTLTDMDNTANRVMAAVGASVDAAAQPALEVTAGVRRLALVQELDKVGEAGKKIKKTVGASIGEALGGVSKILQNLTGAVGESAAAWLSYAANVLQSVSQMIPALMAVAAAEAAAHDAKWLGWIGAAAAITATIAAFAAIPKFAKGGIAYGPTVGMFGEYAGASTNPEVVAPLSNLRQLLDLDRPSQGLPSVIRLVAHGRDLAAVIDTRKNYLSRT